MSEAAPAPPPGSQELRPTNVFLSAGFDAGEWVEQIRHAFQATGLGYQVVKYSANLPLADGEFDLELEEIDAAVIVLTPGYFSTMQAISNEHPALLRAEREAGLPVFRALARPISEDLYEGHFIRPSQLLIEKPLAEMDDPERAHALGTLVRAVEHAVSVSTRRQQKSEANIGATGASGAVQSTSDAPPVAWAERYRLYDATREILDLASSYAISASAPVAVSTSLLLIALAEFGAEDPDRPWSGSWLYRELGGAALGELRDELFEQHGIRPRPERFGISVLSEGAARVLDAAAGIAKQTSGSDEIHSRHMVGALLTDRREPTQSGAMEALERRNIDLAKLRKEYFDFIRGTDDDAAAWSKILLGREVRVYRMSGFHADDARGKDLLGIEQDVLAFATLVAARSVMPPLSIGLFGEWGSGKSFFMRRLRDAVAGLAREAAHSRQMQRDLPFYKRIVQIEFNAWHYVEGNLWASLVEHIFRNLSIPGDRPSASQALQKRLMDDLKFTEQARAEVNEEHRRALREVATARKHVAAARREHERQREALAELAAKEVANDLTAEEVRSKVGPVLERLGIPSVGAGVHDLLGALAEARALVERGRGVFLPLVRAPEGEKRRRTVLLMMVMFLGPAVGWLVGAAVRALGDAAMAQLSALASGAATLLTAGAAWVRSQVKWGSDRLAEVEKAQREVDRRLAEKQAEQTRELRALQERLQLAHADYVAARRSQIASEKRVKQAKAKLEETSVARLLASFIEDRAASADYRKHLGVLALVRNDFETLSGLIEEENWRLLPPGHDDDRYPHTTRFETLEEEKRQAESRINRIVLYIDDLDRCPPNKVVEVLQAVHLLLAFPLFVVVVGVDARWVKRSLEVRYRELLHGGDAQAKDSVTPAELLIGKATTGDYLEKIFQVPFWLRPMDETHTGRMVRELLEGSVAAPMSALSSEPRTNGAQQRDTAVSSSALPDRAVSSRALPNRIGRAELLKGMGRLPDALATYEETIERFPDDIVAQTGRAEVLKVMGRLPDALAAYEETIEEFPDNVVAQIGRAEVLKEMDRLPDALAVYERMIERFPDNVVAQTGRAEVLKRMGKLEDALAAFEKTIAADETDEPQVNLESLVFHHEEMEFIAALAPLLDRSPRALKRFANVYRLIKAGLTPTEHRAFVGEDGPYRAVLFLLAVDTGFPEFADEFFAELQRVKAELEEGTNQSIATLDDLMKAEMEEQREFGLRRPWVRVLKWMRPNPEDEPRFDPALTLLAAWEPRVMRYSFREQG